MFLWWRFLIFCIYFIDCLWGMCLWCLWFIFFYEGYYEMVEGDEIMEVVNEMKGSVCVLSICEGESMKKWNWVVVEVIERLVVMDWWVVLVLYLIVFVVWGELVFDYYFLFRLLIDFMDREFLWMNDVRCCNVYVFCVWCIWYVCCCFFLIDGDCK